jgi:NCS1 family nucleobase:cation symporter-1
MRAVDLSPVPPDQQTARPFDLFLIFVGANIVSTTLQVGASLPPRLGLGTALVVIAAGALGGAALVAALAPIGPRLRAPSIVAARAALGFGGARTLAAILFTTNFAWIALNNVIAASIVSRLAGVWTQPAWGAALGLLATLIVLGGPRAAAWVDRVAVPMLFVSGLAFTIACLRAPSPAWPAGPVPAIDVVRGLDIVAGYQITWLLMFADYPRFVRSPRAARVAVFLGLALTALWFMPLGLVASTLAGSADPGAMVLSLGLGWWGAILLAVATLTTNFVNIYMSALAFKSLKPGVGDAGAVWLIGGVGATLSLLSTGWIEQFANLTLILAGVLVPVGGILVAHYFLLRREVRVDDLYDLRGRYAAHGGWSRAAATAWIAGGAAFYMAQSVGGTVTALAVSIAAYAALARMADA